MTQPPHNPELNEAERRDGQTIWDLRQAGLQETGFWEGIWERIEKKTEKKNDMQNQLACGGASRPTG